MAQTEHLTSPDTIGGNSGKDDGGAPLQLIRRPPDPRLAPPFHLGSSVSTRGMIIHTVMKFQDAYNTMRKVIR